MARKTCTAIAVLYEQKISGLPMFRKDIDMDLSHAYLWNTIGHVPLATVLNFWFMADPITDERARVWLLNLDRFASEPDCIRALKNLADKSFVITKTMSAQLSIRVVAPAREFSSASLKLESSRDEFKNFIESWKFPDVYMATDLETTCRKLRSGQMVNECRVPAGGSPTHHILAWI